MVKESLITLGIASPSDVYPLKAIEDYFDRRHISYVIRDGVTLKDENGVVLTNQETGEVVVVKRLIIPEISNVQIILDESKDFVKGNSYYHIVVVSDVDDKLYPVTLDTLLVAIMKVHNERLMPYYFVDASVALPAEDGWYVCLVEGEGVRELFYRSSSMHKWWRKSQGEGEPDANECFGKPVVAWLSVSAMIKMADTLFDEDLFIRATIDDDYVMVSGKSYDLLAKFALKDEKGEDQNDV